MLVIILMLSLAVMSIIIRKSDYASWALKTTIVIGLITILVWALGMGLRQRACDEIEQACQTIVTQYLDSKQTSDDWEWVTAQCEQINESIDNIETDHVFYLWLDWLYLIAHLSAPNSLLDDTSLQTIVITEESIEFPAHYNLIPLHKSITAT